MKTFLVILTTIIFFHPLFGRRVFEETQAFQPVNYTQDDSGSEENPYLISNLANLRWLSENQSVWGSTENKFYFKQTADIEASETRVWNGGHGFSPIGFCEYNIETEIGLGHYFWGDYDGDGFVINGLYINCEDSEMRSSVGLFGAIKSSNISKVRLSNIDITSLGITGSIVGVAIDSSIEHSSSTGSITDSNPDHIIGGIVGHAENSNISFCFSKVNVKTENYPFTWMSQFVGGLAGVLQNESTLESSYFIGQIERKGASTGGLVGKARGSEIWSSYAISRKPFHMHSGLVARLIDSTMVSCMYDSKGAKTIFAVLDIQNSWYRVSAPMSLSKRDDVLCIGSHGWDFENVWDVNKRINSGYPFLRSISAKFQ